MRVTYGDKTVPSPHLVTLRVRNTGPRDISSDRFDNGEALHVNLNTATYGLVNFVSPGPGAVRVSVPGAEDTTGYVKFLPRLLPRNTEWVADVLVSGAPTPELTSHLIDTDIIVAKEGSPSALDEFAANLVGGGGLAAGLIRAILR